MCHRIGHRNQVGFRAKADLPSGPAANDLERLTPNGNCKIPEDSPRGTRLPDTQRNVSVIASRTACAGIAILSRSLKSAAIMCSG